MDVQACSLLLHLWEHPTYPATAFPHSSSLSLRSLLLAPNQAATCSSVKLKTALSMQIQHPAIDSHSPDRAYKLCRLADSRKAEQREQCIKAGLSRLLAV
jgi:hypothetical protein